MLHIKLNSGNIIKTKSGSKVKTDSGNYTISGEYNLSGKDRTGILNIPGHSIAYIETVNQSDEKM